MFSLSVFTILHTSQSLDLPRVKRKNMRWHKRKLYSSDVFFQNVILIFGPFFQNLPRPWNSTFNEQIKEQSPVPHYWQRNVDMVYQTWLWFLDLLYHVVLMRINMLDGQKVYIHIMIHMTFKYTEILKCSKPVLQQRPLHIVCQHIPVMASIMTKS